MTTEFSGGGAGGPCSGTSTTVCYLHARDATVDDPKSLTWTWFDEKIRAHCLEYELPPGQSFLQAACDPDIPGHIRIGQLPNGQCCYIEVGSGITARVIDLEYDVYICKPPLCTLEVVNE